MELTEAAKQEQIIHALLLPPVFIQLESAQLPFAQAVEYFTFSLRVEISCRLLADLRFKLQHLCSYVVSLLRSRLHKGRTDLEFPSGHSLLEPFFQLFEDESSLYVQLLVPALKAGVLCIKDGQAQVLALFIRQPKPAKRLE